MKKLKKTFLNNSFYYKFSFNAVRYSILLNLKKCLNNDSALIKLSKNTNKTVMENPKAKNTTSFSKRWFFKYKEVR